jgi:hypothetical protein
VALLAQGPRRLAAPEAASGGPATWSSHLRRYGLLLLAVLAATQFVGAYLYLEWPYLNIQLWEQGSAPLPFQTRLLLAPLYRFVDTSWWGIWYAEKLSRNDYFFPHGVTPAVVLEFYIGIACVLFSGWVAVRIYLAASRVHLLPWLVYPLFLAICCVTYVLHTVQNFSYVYDLPSLAAFSLGFYLIYFRKPLLWFVIFFAIATLNRETTLLILPFWALSQGIGSTGGVVWKNLFRPRVLLVLTALGIYWLVWHRVVYSVFAHNASEFYTRPLYNLKFYVRLRYWPQLASAFGYLWPFLIVYRKQVKDAQLRAWLLVLPVWYGFMLLWGVITETRIFGETIPMLAPVAVLIVEEHICSRIAALPRSSPFVSALPLIDAQTDAEADAEAEVEVEAEERMA